MFPLDMFAEIADGPVRTHQGHTAGTSQTCECHIYVPRASVCWGKLGVGQLEELPIGVVSVFVSVDEFLPWFWLSWCWCPCLRFRSRPIQKVAIVHGSDLILVVQLVQVF